MKLEVKLYVECLADIKGRMDFIRTDYVDIAVREDVPQMKLEGACLQLRISIELLCLASLVAHRETYEAEWSDYKKNNDFSTLVKRLRRINEQFMPTAVKLAGRRPDGIMEMVDAPIQIKVDQLVEAHGRTGNILHARNPYRERHDLANYQDMLRENYKHLVLCLQNHVAILATGEHVFLQMNKNNEQISASLLNERG